MTTRTHAGDMLRQWRSLRGKSQLDLAFDTGITQKHVSFVETGRSTPSRQMIVDLSDALAVPLRDRNAILLAAGYAPVYGEAPLDGPEMARIRRAVTRMLRQHEPFPAMAMDRYWNVIETNEAAPAFFGRFVDLERWPKPRNLLRLMFDPAGLRPSLARWEATAQSLLARVRREAVGGVIDEKMRGLLAELAAHGEDAREAGTASQNDRLPMTPLRFMCEGEAVELFSMVTTVGAPQSATAEEIRLETMFPVDDEAENLYLKFVARGG